MKVVWRESALADLENAIAYIARGNVAAAGEQLRRIERQAESLADHPLLGREGRLEGTRELVVARTPFIVVYTLTAHVELVRILHGAQAWPPAG
ncbi:hypothetical protein GCM10007874_62080 [Labrys miyagiensis]|uniref:Type II toxin-antitoxin system RelE/ParE family toxin n=1 Tax=Labrys miyagiensis TaxID=346912 RepID=A0ABQ6CS75_9HYPH|nr:type II toxin-antitoxin system RelE/ParE family toxin [Labrys miyagiensis]GLS23188.1 hypothetical protein GCM10007874_62080 [Labrys miyagiensis]